MTHRRSLKFFVVWRGYGPLAFIPIPLGVVAITIAVAGAGVLLAARFFKGTGKYHSLCYIPLRAWGVIYIVLGLGLAVWKGDPVSQEGWRN